MQQAGELHRGARVGRCSRERRAGCCRVCDTASNLHVLLEHPGAAARRAGRRWAGRGVLRGVRAACSGLSTLYGAQEAKLRRLRNRRQGSKTPRAVRAAPQWRRPKHPPSGSGSPRLKHQWRSTTRVRQFVQKIAAWERHRPPSTALAAANRRGSVAGREWRQVASPHARHFQ